MDYKINSLTDQEVLALTDADLDKMIKLAMAEAGIKLVEQPKEPLYHEIPLPDKTAFSIENGFNYWFTNQIDAEKVLDLLESSTLLDWGWDKDYKEKYAKPLAKIRTVVSRQIYHSAEQFNAIAVHLDSNKKLKEEYTEKLNEYNNAYEEASYIREDIYKVYNAIQKKYQNFEYMLEKFNQYLSF